MTQPVFRFAPSPNGRIGLGRAYSALLDEQFARWCGGRFLLRIEDIDTTRCLPELDMALQDDLAWLFLTWGGPVCRQNAIISTITALRSHRCGSAAGSPCFCSRKAMVDTVAPIEQAEGRIWPRDPDGAPVYPGTCRALDPRQAETRIAAGEDHAWRIDMAKALAAAPGPHASIRFDIEGQEQPIRAHPERWGDAVIVRKEVPTSYHLAVVVDDALQGITHVVRGTDLEPATDLHVLLQALLGLKAPRYHHHGLILDRWGAKLAKSRQSESLAELRERGISAAEIRTRLGFPI